MASVPGGLGGPWKRRPLPDLSPDKPRLRRIEGLGFCCGRLAVPALSQYCGGPPQRTVPSTAFQIHPRRGGNTLWGGSLGRGHNSSLRTHHWTPSLTRGPIGLPLVTHRGHSLKSFAHLPRERGPRRSLVPNPGLESFPQDFQRWTTGRMEFIIALSSDTEEVPEWPLPPIKVSLHHL